jgi:chromosome segregation ATPase
VSFRRSAGGGRVTSEIKQVQTLVSAEISSEIAGWDGIATCLAQIRACHEQYEGFFGQVFDELDAVATGIRAAQAQAVQLADVVRELGQTRGELAAARHEMLGHREELRGAAEAAAAVAPAEHESRLEEQLHHSEEERLALQQERALLESELETVRSRAAEMAETLSQQKRQISEERDQQSEELRRMRHLLEGLAGRLAEPPPAASPETLEPPARSAAPPAGDAVLDSVMAQFQMLQKDRARRREKPVESGQT